MTSMGAVGVPRGSSKLQEHVGNQKMMKTSLFEDQDNYDKHSHDGDNDDDD